MAGGSRDAVVGNRRSEDSSRSAARIRRSAGQEAGSVVQANMWSVRREGVGDSDGVGLGHVARRLIGSDPAQVPRLVRVRESAADDGAAKDERDDSARHVLVNACQRLRLDVKPGFLAHLTQQPVVNGLVELQDPARRLPVGVVPALECQDAAPIVDDDCSHTD